MCRQHSAWIDIMITEVDTGVGDARNLSEFFDYAIALMSVAMPVFRARCLARRW